MFVKPGTTTAAFKIDMCLLTYLKRLLFRVLAFLRLLRQIKRGNYSKAYVLHFNLKDALVPYVAGVPERIGLSQDPKQPCTAVTSIRRTRASSV